MGGKAFLQYLPSASFPRLPPAFYSTVKASILPRLTPLFRKVAVPHEAPEKSDHGDVDFVVYGPRDDLQYEDIEFALGACARILSPEANMKGTSNFALALADFEGAVSMIGSRIAAEQSYVQVDVKICVDEDEWERVMFFHAYGDLGMLMGRLGDSIGLHIGEKGLKMTSSALGPTHSTTFVLSSSFPSILSFLGLSMARWEAGFHTQGDAFWWIASSRFYDPRRIYQPRKRVVSLAHRTMYRAFFLWNNLRKPDQALGEDEGFKHKVGEEALIFFGQKGEHDALVVENERRVRLKAMWNGRRVGEWTGWRGWNVGRVMAYARGKVGEEGIACMDEGALKELVMEGKRVVEEEKAREHVELTTSDMELAESTIPLLA